MVVLYINSTHSKETVVKLQYVLMSVILNV